MSHFMSKTQLLASCALPTAPPACFTTPSKGVATPLQVSALPRQPARFQLFPHVCSLLERLCQISRCGPSLPSPSIPFPSLRRARCSRLVPVLSNPLHLDGASVARSPSSVDAPQNSGHERAPVQTKHPAATQTLGLTMATGDGRKTLRKPPSLWVWV